MSQLHTWDALLDSLNAVLMFIGNNRRCEKSDGSERNLPVKHKSLNPQTKEVAFLWEHYSLVNFQLLEFLGKADDTKCYQLKEERILKAPKEEKSSKVLDCE